jgi:ABC-type nickel/cobalt efflux system permease component RcnA
MRRLLPLLVVAFALLATPAGAHPLGNFSINHVAEVSVSADRVDVRYRLDQAEIPTFQERAVARTERVRRKQAEVLRRLRVVADGRALALVPGTPQLELRPGAGGLETTRFELALSARLRARRVEVRDRTFLGRVGWRAIVARPGRGTAVRSSVPATDPTHGLTRYPNNALTSPADTRTARLEARPGNGTVSAPGDDAALTPPRAGGKPEAETVEDGAGRADAGSEARAVRSDGLSGLFEDAASGEGVLILLLLAAFGWGAVHALSPGHGKAMVAAYLVGTRGTAKHAAALGATVTVTHTAGVLLLGVVALTLSAFVLPEQLYPWLNLASGLLVVIVGGAVLRSRARRKRAHHHHHHHHPEDLSAKGILAMGASAGLIPCPSALVVLLGAVAQHQLALGLVMIVAFSLGLATTLTVLGIGVVHASRAAARLPVPGRVVAALPTASALVIVGVGLMLTLQAAGQLT